MPKIDTIAGGDTLILNSDGAPINMIPHLSTLSWKDAISKVIAGKVDVLDYFDKTVRSQYEEIRIPAIVITKQWCSNPRVAKFNSKTVFLRDNYICQYCHNEFTESLLTMDHCYTPKSKGGKLCFENVVTSCMPCNSSKGNKFFKPLNAPFVPTYYDLVQQKKKRSIRINHPSWAFYIGWDENKIILNDWKFRI